MEALPERVGPAGPAYPACRALVRSAPVPQGPTGLVHAFSALLNL